MADISTLERQWRLLQLMIARRNGETVAGLAVELQVSGKTIRRDLALLQKVGFPLSELVGHKGLKRWKVSAEHGPPPAIRWDEAATLYLSRRLMQPLAGTALADSWQSLTSKIELILSDEARRYLDRMAAMWFVTQPPAGNYTAHGCFIDSLTLAIEEHRLTLLTYQSQAATEPVTYEVHPYGLVLHRGSLYLVAYAPHHSEVRHYKVDRISDVDVQGLKFTKPTGFDLQSHLAGSFGIYHSTTDRTVRVRVRFSADVARYVQEKHWHASQRLTLQPDRSVIAEFNLRATEELKTWVLSFGSQAEILEPDSLRQQIARDVAQLHQMYRPALKHAARKMPR